MTTPAVTAPNDPVGYLPPDDPKPAGGPRSLWARAAVDTLGRTGARIGIAWVSLVALLAVFAPLIANSRPIIARYADGSLGSPLLGALTTVDVTLLLLFAAAAVLLVVSRLRHVTARTWLLTLLVILAVGAPLAAVVTDPPVLYTLDQWRLAEADGQIEWALHTLIPFSPNDAQPDLLATGVQPTRPPSARHWLGTTTFGEDMLSRIVHACRIALAIGFVATGISTLIGVFFGTIMGYFAGWTDLLMMRGIEIIEVIPRIVLLIIVTQFVGKNIWVMMITIGLVSWTSDARFIRAEFLKLRKLDFVQAGVALGLPLRSLLFRHMLPNGIAPVLVNASFGIAAAILLESVLSFLGLGLEASVPSWGQLLNQALDGGINWWIVVFPGLMIFLTVFSYILIGEAMRDALDPKLREAD